MQCLNCVSTAIQTSKMAEQNNIKKCTCDFSNQTGVFDLEKRDGPSIKEKIDKMPILHKVMGEYAPITIDTPKA